MLGGTVMKKLFALLLTFMIMLAATGGYCRAGSETEVSIYLEGEKIIFPDAQPIHTGTRVLVPVRGFFDRMGVTVDWIASKRMVIIKDDSREIMLEADNRAVLNNGAVEYLDCSVVIRNNRAFIPIRYISESFGYDVEWDGKTKSVHVSKASQDPAAASGSKSVLPTVDNLENLYHLLKYNGYMSDYLHYDYFDSGIAIEPEFPDFAAPESGTAAEAPAQSPSNDADYSGTNIQVKGVDEGDIVKTDGKYIYIAGTGGLKIVNADPDDLRVISSIPYSGRIDGIYIQKDRLILIKGNSRFDYIVPGISGDKTDDSILGRTAITSTNVKVYDVSDRSGPVLVSDKEYEGRYLSSRLIGDDLYIVTNSRVRFFGDYLHDKLAGALAANDKKQFAAEMKKVPAGERYVLQMTGAKDSGELFDNLRSTIEHYITPKYVDNETGEVREISLKDIYYFRDMVRPNYMITIGLDLESGNEDIKAYLGSSGSMYVSTEHMYAAVSAYEYNILRSRLEGSPSYDYLTTVYRFGLKDGRVTYEAKGRVPGQIFNQFSMDEYDGIFRIATTSREPYSSTSNNVYTLGEDLKIVGRLEGIAKGEKIYSTRFAGERIYMVTFRQMDPFFVIDAADPGKLKVLGYLKIPGYSTYMHILDKDHVLGFGYETEERSGWGFDTTGFKLSLFDVSDVSNPVEAKKEVIGKNAESPLGIDHKALMISLDKGVMGFPIIYINTESDYFAGFFLYNISSRDFSYRGRVTHVPDDISMYEISDSDFIYRGIYIGDYLYTVSEGQLQVHDLGTLVRKGSLVLK